MGGGVICFGLFVISVVILGKENEVNAVPAPAPIPSPDICMYRSGRRRGPPTTPAPSEDNSKDQRKEKLKMLEKLLEEIYQMDKDAEKKKQEEEAKKKEGPRGYNLWESYVKFLTDFSNSYSF